MRKRYTIHSKVPDITKAFEAAWHKKTRKLFILVYHKGRRVKARPWGEGFQPTPWKCPHCKKVVMADDLRYALASLPIKKRKTCAPPGKRTKRARRPKKRAHREGPRVGTLQTK